VLFLIICSICRAREFGIKNGMFLGTARKLCRSLKVMPYEFDQYEIVSFLFSFFIFFSIFFFFLKNKVSTTLFEILLKYTTKIQIVSCDEAFFQLPNGYEIDQTLDKIRQEFFDKTCKSFSLISVISFI
jgi:nucleotidyltransferase/DNA polymerase involved in DNA repair